MPDQSMPVLTPEPDLLDLARYRDESQALQIVSNFVPAGDQPDAIAKLTEGVMAGEQDQVLLGVTGSGKTFTVAHLLQNVQRPSVILAPNKTLAAQLYGEMKSFFPNNAVEYFVSYYDYYQPEAYVARTDTYVEKEASINEQIDRMRHSATRALFERKDVVIVASISCIYGMGSPETYIGMTLGIEVGLELDPRKLLARFVELQYKRNDIAFTRGTFRVRGDTIEIFPAHAEDRAWRLSFFGDEVEAIHEFDPLTGEKGERLDRIRLYANSHHVTPRPTILQAIKMISADLEVRLKEFGQQGKLLEAQRLEQRVRFDLEMMESTGACAGIENYSRYLTGRSPGAPPPTIFEYIPDDALLIIDESHVAVPQIGGMYKGDRSRKENLSSYGFRLPSCADNRPLKFEEWHAMRPQTIYVSATPGNWELEQTSGVFVEQVIRPTGLTDPEIEIRPTENQIDDLIAECLRVSKLGYRILVTTLTKRMSEDLTDYLNESGLRVRYIHSGIETLERIEIIRDLRLGLYDVLIGINLLREGLDIPECALVAILDADKEGYLRSETSLIQTIGRAARNVEGRVILYADRETGSMQAAMAETSRRRIRQQSYNAEKGITPESIKKDIANIMGSVYENDRVTVGTGDEDLAHLVGQDLKATLANLEKLMLEAATNLEFEEAARLRDEIRRLEEAELTFGTKSTSNKVAGTGKASGRSSAGFSGTEKGQNSEEGAAKRKKRPTRKAGAGKAGTGKTAINPLERVAGPVKRRKDRYAK